MTAVSGTRAVSAAGVAGYRFVRARPVPGVVPRFLRAAMDTSGLIHRMCREYIHYAYRRKEGGTATRYAFGTLRRHSSMAEPTLTSRVPIVSREACVLLADVTRPVVDGPRWARCVRRRCMYAVVRGTT